MSAWLMDAILLMILALGVLLLMTSVLNVRQHYDDLQRVSQRYETEANVSFGITQEEYQAMTEAERAAFEKDRSPYPVSVVNREMLYICNKREASVIYHSHIASALVIYALCSSRDILFHSVFQPHTRTSRPSYFSG